METLGWNQAMKKLENEYTAEEMLTFCTLGEKFFHMVKRSVIDEDAYTAFAFKKEKERFKTLIKE